MALRQNDVIFASRVWLRLLDRITHWNDTKCAVMKLRLMTNVIGKRQLITGYDRPDAGGSIALIFL
jgi:hypothetical protein